MLDYCPFRLSEWEKWQHSHPAYTISLRSTLTNNHPLRRQTPFPDTLKSTAAAASLPIVSCSLVLSIQARCQPQFESGFEAFYVDTKTSTFTTNNKPIFEATKTSYPWPSKSLDYKELIIISACWCTSTEAFQEDWRGKDYVDSGTRQFGRDRHCPWLLALTVIKRDSTQTHFTFHETLANAKKRLLDDYYSSRYIQLLFLGTHLKSKVWDHPYTGRPINTFLTNADFTQWDLYFSACSWPIYSSYISIVYVICWEYA